MRVSAEIPLMAFPLATHQLIGPTLLDTALVGGALLHAGAIFDELGIGIEARARSLAYEQELDVRTGEVRGGTQVETLPIIGPQHTHTYAGFALAILYMPVDNTHKSAIVTPESPQADIRGAGGGECKLKLNSDRTLDAQCNQAGGTVFVVFK